MTAGLLAAVLCAAVLAGTAAGPWLLRHASPFLVRVPRLAVLVIAGGLALWLVALLAIGPVLAWAAAGPALLPEGAADVCRRCLSAANPFPGQAASGPVPAVLLLAPTAALTLVVGAGLLRSLLRADAQARRAAGVLLPGAQHRWVQGHDVTVVEAERAFALTLPARRGGIVLSTAALHALADDELAAVLAHEHAHLRQRHHLVSALVDGLAAPLLWVPVVRAAVDALPHYLEIAADDRARRSVGTPALVGALLKLGERGRPGATLPAGPAVLQAAGPERIRHLVRPVGGWAGALPAGALAGYLVGMAALSAAVHLPYAAAALSGCGL